MPRAPRVCFQGAFYHVFNRGVEKRRIFMDDQDRRAFLRLLSEIVPMYELRLFSYCLMENHFHLFLQTKKLNLSEAMHDLQGQYAQYLNRRYDRVGYLFQNRYKSPLVNEEQYALALTRYIHRNPLEAGLVKKLEDYQWSSYPSYIGILPAWKWLETHWLLRQFHENPETAVQVFRFFHQMEPPQAEQGKIQKMRPLLGDLAPSTPKGARPL